jgi:hypothetical protein
MLFRQRNHSYRILSTKTQINSLKIDDWLKIRIE